MDSVIYEGIKDLLNVTNILTVFVSIISIILTGWILVHINVRTHAKIESKREKRDREQLVKRNLKPVLKAAEGLISRFTEILVMQQDEMIRAIKSYDEKTFSDRIPTMSPISMNRHESTAFRLINFLAIANYFGRQTAKTPSFPLLDRVEYYLQHKIPVGLRGNLYDRPLLSTEVQEELSASLLECYKENKAQDFSVGQFCDYVKTGRYKPEYFKEALRVFSVDVGPISNSRDINHGDENWQRILVLSHICVYLMDFFQELDKNPRWEEHRIFLVGLIRQWNASATSHIYLYDESGLLSTKNYLDSYPGREASRHFLFGLADWIPEIVGFRRIFKRVIKYCLLNIRGRRFGNRHPKKAIGKRGVKINVKGKWEELPWNTDLKTLHLAVLKYLHLRYRFKQYSE